MSGFKSIILASLVLVTGGNSQFLFADCSTTPTYISVTAGDMLGANNAANTGGMLSSVWHNGVIQFNCTNLASESVQIGLLSNFISQPVSTTTKSIVFEGKTYGLVQTSSPDIYMIFSWENWWAMPPGFNSTLESPQLKSPDKQGNLNTTFPIRVRFVAEPGALAPGIRTISQQAVVSNVIWTPSPAMWCPPRPNCTNRASVGSLLLKPFTFYVNAISCKFLSPANVTLDKISMYSLPQAGSTVDAANFQIGVSCEKSYVPYKVHYEMIDAATPSNVTENLTLRNVPGQASGVKLQLLDGRTPIKYGPRSSSSQAQGLFGDMPEIGGSIYKTLTARYIRVGSSVVPGKVNAGVTVTLTYE